MPLYECPGPNRKEPAVPEEVDCPECGQPVEMWANEKEAICPSCSHKISRDQLPGKPGKTTDN